MTYLLIALGGALGACLRFLISQQVSFPFGTLAVNIVGSFLMGLAFVALSIRVDQRVSMFFMTGFLGAFTTYSAFSLDVLKLVETGRVGFAATYVTTTLGGAIAALFLGVFVMRSII